MVLGSGSIRKEELGPIVTFQDMKENTPFDDGLWMLKVKGEQLRRMVSYVFRDEAWSGHTEFYQYSRASSMRCGRVLKFVMAKTKKRQIVLSGLCLRIKLHCGKGMQP